MAIRDHILAEYDHEMATTRRTLERVPEGKSDWKPHQKSMSMGRLAGHLAELPSLGLRSLQSDSFDVRAPGRPSPFVMTTSSELLGLFDKNVAEARAAISVASDEDLMKNWALTAGDKTIFSMPRAAVLRTFCVSHMVHHRAQLGVYLRMNDVPVPHIYGPSADDNPFA
jgi:uncharacterized damage-inducible protein DinB